MSRRIRCVVPMRKGGLEQESDFAGFEIRKQKLELKANCLGQIVP
jgi:hypothetical protein